MSFFHQTEEIIMSWFCIQFLKQVSKMMELAVHTQQMGQMTNVLLLALWSCMHCLFYTGLDSYSHVQIIQRTRWKRPKVIVTLDVLFFLSSHSSWLSLMQQWKQNQQTTQTFFKEVILLIYDFFTIICIFSLYLSYPLYIIIFIFTQLLLIFLNCQYQQDALLVIPKK